MFSDNWYLIEGPGQPSALLLLGRLVQLALLGISGIAGYLCVRRWGLGVAIGGALPIVWLAASTLFDLTDTPVGPGLRQPGRRRDRAARRDDHRRQRGGGDRHPRGRRGLRPERRANAVRQNASVTTIELRSDNTAGVAPEILAAVAAANAGTALAYGGDELTAQLAGRRARGVRASDGAGLPGHQRHRRQRPVAERAVPAVGCGAVPRVRRTSSTASAGRHRCSAAGP